MVKSVLRGVALTLLASVALLATGPVASAAGVIVGSKVKLQNPGYPAGAGANGEFSVFVKQGSSYDFTTVDFYTFCVEKTQQFFVNEEMTVAALGKSTDGTSPNFQLTKQVAWLFREFQKSRLGIAGAITNFYRTDNAANMNADANALQEAIWALTSPSQGSVTPGNKYINYLATYNWAVNALTEDAFSIGGVQIMVLKVGSSHRQDQLYVDLNGLSTNPVPEPASIAFWLTSVGAVAFARRRRQVNA